MDAAGPSPAEAAVLNEALERRLEALADPELRQIALWRLEGYTNREIADRLDCTERSVERRAGADSQQVDVVRRRWVLTVRVGATRQHMVLAWVSADPMEGCHGRNPDRRLDVDRRGRRCASSEQWKDGAGPRIEEFLADVDESRRPRLLEELLRVERELLQRAGSLARCRGVSPPVPGQCRGDRCRFQPGVGAIRGGELTTPGA